MQSKKAVLIIHGLSGHIREHQETADYLKKEFDVYTFLLPGHDDSLFSNPKKEEWIEESEKQIDDLYRKGYEDIYVIGHSMGGVIGAYLSIKYDRIKKIVLEAPAFGSNSNPGFKLISGMFKYYGISYILGCMKKFSPNILKEFRNLVNEYMWCAEKINIPTLIIQGDKDIFISSDRAQELFDKIPADKKYYFLVKDVPHAIFYSDKKTEVMLTIKDFLFNDDFDKDKYEELLNSKKI